MNSNLNGIEQEIDALWSAVSLDTGLDAPYDPEFGKGLDTFGAKSKAAAQFSLQPWLAILEQGIKWLVCLHISLTDEEKPLTDDLRAPWALTGAACTQAVGIRHLCLSGLDLPAKAVLRTLIETLNTCTVVIEDKTLRRRFVQAQDPNQTRQLWHKHFRERKLRERIAEILSAYEVEPELQTAFHDWQNEEMRLASQAIHVSYTAAVFATYPYPVEGTTFHLGVLGAPTLFSIRTLSQASRAIWFFSRVGFGLLIRPQKDGDAPLYQPSKDNVGDRIVINGHSVFQQLMLRYWDKDQIDVGSELSLGPPKLWSVRGSPPSPPLPKWGWGPRGPCLP